MMTPNFAELLGMVGQGLVGVGVLLFIVVAVRLGRTGK